MKIITRDVPPRAAWALEQSGLHPLLARLFAARGISQREELDDDRGRPILPARIASRITRWLEAPRRW